MTRCQGTIRLFYSYDAHLVFMYACIKKGGRLENKRFFELKSEEYRDGIKRKGDKIGMGHKTLHIQ